MEIRWCSDIGDHFRNSNWKKQILNLNWLGDLEGRTKFLLIMVILNNKILIFLVESIIGLKFWWKRYISVYKDIYEKTQQFHIYDQFSKKRNKFKSMRFSELFYIKIRSNYLC